MSGSSEEKDLPASDKKLKDARKKGQVGKSTEFVTAAVTLTGFFYVMTQIPRMADSFIHIIEAAGDAADKPLWVVVRPLVGRIELVAAGIIGPMILLVVLAAIIGSVTATGGPVLSFEPLMPKLETLNPIGGFKKLFGLRKLMDLLKNIFKVIAIGLLSFLMIKNSLQPLVEQPSCGLRCAPGVLTGTMRPIFIMGSVFFLVIGIADMVLQKWLFARDQRMTKTEMKQETKNTEGDPVVKGQQKRMQREASQSKIGMRQASFVISGSGIFVAMRYNSADTRVPTLVARGEGDKAADMLQMARAQRLPISYDADAARAVFDQVRLGSTISKEMFQLVIGVMKTLNIF